MPRPHIVIIGAGFGGMYVAKKLGPRVRRKKIDVTVINRTNYFLFTPLLHEVATGGLSPSSVAEPLREALSHTGIRIVQGSVESIDSARRTVAVRGELGRTELSYDYLIISTGAVTNDYGIPGVAEHTYPLKTLADAVAIRARVIDVFEQAMLAKDEAERRNLLSFAVVGGGPTGVEVAAELSEFIAGMVKRYYHDTNCAPGDPGSCSPEEPSLVLIHASKELLEQFKPALRLRAARRLMKNGVTLQLNSTVIGASASGLTLAGNVSVPAATAIWTAGVKPALPAFEGKAPALSGGRLIVDEFFHLQGEERIFAMGDVAAYVDIHNFIQDTKNTRPLPMLAQVAVAESSAVARNVATAVAHKPLSRFRYKSKGNMVSVGEWFAIGEIFSMDIAGPLAWWVWRTIYLFKFSSWKKRARIAFEWSLNLLYPRDITKLT